MKTDLPEDGINECRNTSKSHSVYDVMYTIQCIELVAVTSYQLSFNSQPGCAACRKSCHNAGR